MPLAAPVFEPLIQAHVPGWPAVAFGVYTHRSLRAPLPFVPVESSPQPPWSQRFPPASVQPLAPQRDPGNAPVVETGEQMTVLPTVRPTVRPHVPAAPVVFTGPTTVVVS